MRLIDRLFRDLEKVDGVVACPSQFSAADALWVNGREVAHKHEHALDVRLTRQVIRARRAELRADPRVALRGSTSDWLEVAVHQEDDVHFARALLMLAVDAHRAQAGEQERPPPTRAELERRRHFH